MDISEQEDALYNELYAMIMRFSSTNGEFDPTAYQAIGAMEKVKIDLLTDWDVVHEDFE